MLTILFVGVCTGIITKTFKWVIRHCFISAAFLTSWKLHLNAHQNRIYNRHLIMYNLILFHSCIVNKHETVHFPSISEQSTIIIDWSSIITRKDAIGMIRLLQKCCGK